jgi:uncharacterized iron-regulated membrane protein
MSIKKPKRMTIMKIHGYFSVFFMALLFIYTLTGILYLLDSEGSNSIRTEITHLESWPVTEQQALDVMPQILKLVGEDELPDNYSDRRGHAWSDFTKSISLAQNPEDKTILVTVKTPDFMRQMLMIHKGNAGPLFTVLGICLGIYILLMLITGAWLSFKTKPMHRGSLMSAGAGILLVFISYCISSY